MEGIKIGAYTRTCSLYEDNVHSEDKGSEFTWFHEIFPIFNVNYFKGMQLVLILGLF